MQNWMMWMIVAVILFIVEMVTPGTFFLACFAIGALLAACLAYLHMPAAAVWSSFFGSSILLVLFARPLVKRLLKTGDHASNVDELIGKEALVLEGIEPHKPGIVKVGGEQWKAEASEPIAVGARVEIVKIEGTRVIVTKRR